MGLKGVYMLKNRLIVAGFAFALMVSFIPCSWAEDPMPARNEPSGGAVAGAVVSDIIYIPGKVCTCVLSGAFWTVGMVLTAGTIYKDAGCFVHNACGGKWVIRGEDMSSPQKM